MSTLFSSTRGQLNNKLRGSGKGLTSTSFSSAVSVSFPLETSLISCEPGCTKLVNAAASGAKLLNSKNFCFKNSLQFLVGCRELKPVRFLILHPIELTLGSTFGVLNEILPSGAGSAVCRDFFHWHYLLVHMILFNCIRTHAWNLNKGAAT